MCVCAHTCLCVGVHAATLIDVCACVRVCVCVEQGGIREQFLSSIQENAAIAPASGQQCSAGLVG